MSLRKIANLLKYTLCLLLFAGTFALSTTSDVLAQNGASLPKGDIVFVFDESGSFYDDHEIVKANLNLIVTLLEDVIDYQFGLVGFGAYRGHGNGGRTVFAGEPHIHQTLTSDMMQFSESLKSLIRVGKAEYGFNAIELAASDRLGYRSDAASCIIMITDEDADFSEEYPVTKMDAITAIRQAEAYFLGVVEFDEGETLSQYGPLAGSIAQETGGKVFDIYEFREEPVLVLRDIINSCIQRVQEVAENGTDETETPPDTTMPPDDDGGDDGGGGLFGSGGDVDLAPIVTRLVDEHATLFARLRLLEERVAEIEGMDLTVNIPVNIEEKFTNIELTLARYDVLFNNIDANFTQIDARFSAIENNLSSVHASIAELREHNLATDRRFQDIEARLVALEDNAEVSALLAWREEAQMRLDGLYSELMAVQGDFDAVREQLALMEGHHAGFDARFEELHARLSATEARLSDLSASLTGRIDTLTDQLNSFDARFQELSAQFADLDLSALNAQFSNFNNQLEALRQNVTENSRALDELRQMTASWDADIENLRAHVDNLADQVEELSRLGAQVADLNGRFDGLEDRVDSNEAAIGNLRREMTAIEAQIEDILEQLDANAFALQADLDSIASSLGSRIQSLLTRIQSLEASGSGPDQATLDQLENLANLISQLQFKMAELTSKQNGQYEELTARIDTNEEWIMMIEAWLGIGDAKEGETNIDQRMNAIEGALSDLSAQLRDNERALADFQGSIDELRQRISELESRPISGQENVIDPARLRAAQRLAELAFLTAVTSIGLSLLFFLSRS